MKKVRTETKKGEETEQGHTVDVLNITTTTLDRY